VIGLGRQHFELFQTLTGGQSATKSPECGERQRNCGVVRAIWRGDRRRERSRPGLVMLIGADMWRWLPAGLASLADPRRGKQAATGYSPRDQLPRKFGLRLASNASTPSRKSSELRRRL
jgi:hypothetical protein